VEHTHCFSAHGQGGHYHYDTTPANVEYEGYFSLAETVYHIDPPAATHQVAERELRAEIRKGTEKEKVSVFFPP
jgi:hypothetical protein